MEGQTMKRVWLGGITVLLGALVVEGCVALDWDFQAGGEAAGGGGSGGVGSSSGAGAQGTGGAGAEDCVNGADDDGDGKIDCADEDCSLYECAAAVPSGWNPFWVLESTFQDPTLPSTCPDGQAATTLFAQPAALAQTTCSACNCSYSGATCTAPTFVCSYYDSNCASWSMIPYQSQTTSCYNLPSVPSGANYGSCMITTASAVNNPGTCSGDPSVVTGPATFGKELRLCPSPQGAGGGCLPGDACMQKKPGLLQQARTCIVQAGAASCPLGWNVQETIAYEAGTDTRTCSTCQCDPSTVKCTGGKVTMYQENGCMYQSKQLLNLQECVSGIETGIYAASANFVLGTPMPGTCSPATPSGSVQTTGETTICCR